MSDRTYLIKFSDVPLATANSYAQDLQDHLLSNTDGIAVSIDKDDQSTMDLGSTIVLIFGTPAILALAKGVASWLEKHHGTSISIETPDGKLVASGITSTTAIRLTELFSAKGSL